MNRNLDISKAVARGEKCLTQYDPLKQYKKASQQMRYEYEHTLLDYNDDDCMSINVSIRVLEEMHSTLTFMKKTFPKNSRADLYMNEFIEAYWHFRERWMDSDGEKTPQGPDDLRYRA